MSFDVPPKPKTGAIFSLENHTLEIRENYVTIALYRGEEALKKAKELLNENFNI